MDDVDVFKSPLSSINKKLIKSSDENSEMVGGKLPEPKQGCPYCEPTWSGHPEQSSDYRFEVLKLGKIIEEIDLRKPFYTFGRLPGNDIEMAHPTVSRYHAVLQYSPQVHLSEGEEIPDGNAVPERGWYLYDLESTHGTFLNKMPISPKTYIRVRVGHMIRLGASSRHYILQGPSADEEPESELSVTELREKRLFEELHKKEKAEREEKLRRENEGITWGMSEDADEKTDLTINPYASTNHEEQFLQDPKRTLRGFFEREGLDLEYKVDEMSSGTFVCRVELPLDDVSGKPIIAEVCHKGKKKECVIQCALEACRILDRHGLLRQSHHEPLKRKTSTVDSDDDDDFLDRTGDVERKRLRKVTTNAQDTALTYEDLIEQEKELLCKITIVQEDIIRYQETAKRKRETSESQDEDLDSFMENLSEEVNFDKSKIRKLRVEEQRLTAEHKKLQRLLKIAKPAIYPTILKTDVEEKNTKKPLLPLFGKRNKMKIMFSRTETKKSIQKAEVLSNDEEAEEECDGDDKTSNNNMETSPSVSVATVDSKKEANVENSKLVGPAFIPDVFLHNNSETNSELENSSQPNECISSDEDRGVIHSKRKRTRVRNRSSGRDNITSEEEVKFKDNEKYSSWIPPENQTGDGMTSLNQKFGY